jgi:hypothetical protein
MLNFPGTARPDLAVVLEADPLAANVAVAISAIKYLFETIWRDFQVSYPFHVCCFSQIQCITSYAFTPCVKML